LVTRRRRANIVTVTDRTIDEPLTRANEVSLVITHDLSQELSGCGLGGPQPGRGDRHQPSHGCLRSETAGRGERVQAVARQLVGCHVVPYLSGARGLGEQVAIRPRTCAPRALRSRLGAAARRGWCRGALGIRRRLPAHLWRSLTWDRGRQMADHAVIIAALSMPVFFCDPHHP